MNWVHHVDGCGHLLLAAHPPNSLVLWDTDSGNKLWKKNYTEQILSFDMDPFDPRKLAREFAAPTANLPFPDTSLRLTCQGTTSLAD